MSGKTDGLPADLRILIELLEVCLTGTLGTEQWVFLARVVDAATAALFRLPNGMQELRLMSGIFIELCLRTLEHIANDQTVDLRVRRLLGIGLAGWGGAWAGPGAGCARCGRSALEDSDRAGAGEAGANDAHGNFWPRRAFTVVS